MGRGGKKGGGTGCAWMRECERNTLDRATKGAMLARPPFFDTASKRTWAMATAPATELTRRWEPIMSTKPDVTKFFLWASFRPT